MKVGDRVCLAYYTNKKGTISHINEVFGKLVYTINWDHGSVSMINEEFIKLI